jgi:hypothetical protein
LHPVIRRPGKTARKNNPAAAKDGSIRRKFFTI